MTLGLAPGIAAGVISAQDIVAVLAVGASGAGKKATTELLASECTAPPARTPSAASTGIPPRCARTCARPAAPR